MKVRVRHVLSNPEVGGVEQFLARCVPRFDRERFDARVINLRDESDCYRLWGESGAPFIRQRTPGKLLLGSVPALARLLRRERADVVELYGLRANVIGRLAAALAGVPIVLGGVTSTDDWRRWPHVRLDRATAWAVTGWLANSHASKRRLVERERHPADRVRVIHDGVDVQAWRRRPDGEARRRLRRQLGCSDETVLVATVANIRPAKGYPHLVEAVPLVTAARSDCRFVCAGLDMMGGAVQRRARELGVEGSIVFTGPRADVRDLYEAADIALLPSVYEGFGLSLAEAMALELPVVATEVGGIPELVQDGRTGLLVPPADPAALARAVLRLAARPELRRWLGMGGRERVARLFSLDRAVEERQRYYLEELARRRR